MKSSETRPGGIFTEYRDSDDTSRGIVIEESRGFLANGPLYSLLAVYMPVTILAAVISLAQTFFSYSLNIAVIVISGLLSGILASLYCDFMKNNKASMTAANIRGGIIIIAFFYAFSSLLRFADPLSEKFIPYFTNLFSAAGALYTWIYVISLKKIFSARKRFELYSQLYQGKKLQQVLYEDSSFLQYTDENINNTRYKYLVQLVITGLLTILCVFLKREPPEGFYVLLAVMFMGAVLIFSFFEIMKWEHYFSAEGISLSAQDRVKRILGAGIVTFICAAAAVIIASDKSVIPFSIITNFILWFLNLFRSDRVIVHEEIPEFKMGLDVPPQGFTPFSESGIAEEPGKFPEIFQQILKYGFILLAIALFIRFMISPLINRGKALKNMTFAQKLIRIIKELFTGIISGFASFFAYLKYNKSMSKLRKNYSAEDIRRATDSLLNAYSAAKKSDIKSSVTLFARLIVWGADTRKVTWQPHHAPGEFCGFLSDAAPKNSAENLDQINRGIIRCAEIFEKALYSFETLSGGERKEFKILVEEITASPY